MFHPLTGNENTLIKTNKEMSEITFGEKLVGSTLADENELITAIKNQAAALIDVYHAERQRAVVSSARWVFFNDAIKKTHMGCMLAIKGVTFSDNNDIKL